MGIRGILRELLATHESCEGVSVDHVFPDPVYHPMAEAKYLLAISALRRSGLLSHKSFATKFEQGEPFTVELLSTVVETNVYAERIQRNNPDLDFGVTSIPVSREEASWGAGFDLELVRTPQGEYDAAWAFVKHLTSEKFMRGWTLLTRGLGARPAAAVEAYPNDPNWIVSVNQMLTTRHTPYSFEAPDWWNIAYQNHIERAINLEIDPGNAMTQAQQEVLGRYLQGPK
mgnify:CR=1 FL=1